MYQWCQFRNSFRQSLGHDLLSLGVVGEGTSIMVFNVILTSVGLLSRSRVYLVKSGTVNLNLILNVQGIDK